MDGPLGCPSKPGSQLLMVDIHVVEEAAEESAGDAGKQRLRTPRKQKTCTKRRELYFRLFQKHD